MSQMEVYHYVNVSEKIRYQALKCIKDIDVRQTVRPLSVNGKSRGKSLQFKMPQQFELYEQMNQKHRVRNFLSYAVSFV